jgi:hypothetical protein
MRDSLVRGLFAGCLLAGCHGRSDNTHPASDGAQAADRASASHGRVHAEPVAHECLACVMEDRRQRAHEDQVVVVARYLGLTERRLDGHRTRRRCTRSDDVMGVVRFALIGAEPWRDELSTSTARKHTAALVETLLPCPELSRTDYARLNHYDPDDTRRDGLGHAPILRPGRSYLLTFVRHPMLYEDSARMAGRPGAPTLVAVNPR